MIRIVTDTATDITLKEAAEMGIDIVPLTITFEDGVCPQDTDSDFDLFYERLSQSKNLPTTSQPTPESYLKIFESAKKDKDEVLVLALSGGLSGTVLSCNVAKGISEYDKINIIDTRQAILAQRMIVEEAVRLREEGLGLREITQKLEIFKNKVRVSGIIDTLTYLEKGGRIPKGLGAIGNLLSIKPVIVLDEGILKTIGKARPKQADKMLQAEIEKFKLIPDRKVYFGYTQDKEKGQAFMEKTCENYNIKSAELFSIGGVIGTHVGPGCVAICFAHE